MFVERSGTLGEATSQERRDRAQPESRVLGRVVQCDGAHAVLSAFALEVEEGGAGGIWTVGRLVSISLGTVRTVGLVYRIEAPLGHWSAEEANPITVHIELIGEVRDSARGLVFDRGITAYPHIGAVAHRIRSRDLQAVYDLAGRKAMTIGQLSQDSSIAARIAVDDTLNRHFAIVGTTGVGKSSAVSLLLHKAIEARPDLRILILDPHNEFYSAFSDKAIRVDTSTLDLPFWLFRLEEFVEVLFRGREPVAEEIDILRDLIPQAKYIYRNHGSNGLVRRTMDANAITADTPIPYRIFDLIKLIDERMGLLESKSALPVYRSLRSRVEAAVNDPRYHFMFASRLIEDNIHETMGHIFRVPHEGRPITCFELAALPSEVVNSVCSVLARMSFDLAMGSNGAFKLLLLCEEAHRYMPADPRLGFAPTRYALSRIAKEGRKYGCYLGVVTQRPGELDPTVLSQCSTVFAMRLANERDQEIIRSAIADSSASTLSFLSSMGQREAIAFGEGVATTMRMRFERLQESHLPGRGDAPVLEMQDSGEQDVDLGSIIERMRSGGRPAAAPIPNAPTAQAAMAESAREDLLRRVGDVRGDNQRERLRSRFQDESFRRLYE